MTKETDEDDDEAAMETANNARADIQVNKMKSFRDQIDNFDTYRVSQKKNCFMFLLISQLIPNVERRVGYLQNCHNKTFQTVCDSTSYVN